MAVAVRSLAWFLAARSVSAALSGQQLARVQDPNVVFNVSDDGTTVVYSATTGLEIPQGLATDGSGSGFSSSAVVWIVFAFLVGAPLLFVGFRGRRLTLAAAFGMAAALASWSVIVNALDNVGVPDVLLTVCILVMFAMGFALGFLDMARVLGILILGILGGLAVGVRVVLLRSGLLVSSPDLYFVNWIVIGACGMAGSVLVLWRQRYGILNGCASTGSFLCGLGLDLAINQQSGMSRGLRYLIDRNSFHALDTVTNGYSPPTTTVVILAVSLGVTPAFAFGQWKAFTSPFGGTRHDTFTGSVWSQEADEERPVDTPTTDKGSSSGHARQDGSS